VILRATGSRYTDDDTVKLDVYDREGLPCRRCRTPIERIVQAGRSTYFCPRCQVHPDATPAKKARKIKNATGSATRTSTKSAARKSAKRPR
jgi:hypothetical protein